MDNSTILEITFKAKVPGQPKFLCGINELVNFKDGKVILAKDLLSGDEVVVEMPLFPGSFFSIDMVVLKIEVHSFAKNKNLDGKGQRWIK